MLPLSPFVELVDWITLWAFGLYDDDGIIWCGIIDTEPFISCVDGSFEIDDDDDGDDDESFLWAFDVWFDAEAS